MLNQTDLFFLLLGSFMKDFKQINLCIFGGIVLPTVTGKKQTYVALFNVQPIRSYTHVLHFINIKVIIIVVIIIMLCYFVFKDQVLSIMLHAPLNNRSLAPVQTKTITEAYEA